MSTTDAFSYYDVPVSAPSAITELMPGVRNVLEFCALRAGEQVLVIAEHGVDPVVVQALSAGAAYLGAEIHVLSVTPFSAGGWDRSNPSPLLAAIHAEADVIISCTWWGEVHSDPLFFNEVAKRKARFVSLHQTATAASLASSARFPLDLFLLIEQTAERRVTSAQEIVITTDSGTHLTFGEFATSPEHTPLVPGMWRPFPYGGVNFYPNRTDGSFVVEESTATGTPAERTVVHLRDNLVTGIDGGRAADELRRYCPGGYYMRHALIGLNPKVRSAGGTQFEREKHAGNFYLGLDGLDGAGRADRGGPGHAHCDCQFDDVTITLDGELFVDHGRLLLLDDSDIRAAAEQYGPADVLLDPNPRMVLPARYTRRRDDAVGAPAS